MKLDYETSDSAKALLWMDPQQTIEKTHPYMYSQCQVNKNIILVLLDISLEI